MKIEIRDVDLDQKTAQFVISGSKAELKGYPKNDHVAEDARSRCRAALCAKHGIPLPLIFKLTVRVRSINKNGAQVVFIGRWQ